MKIGWLLRLRLTYVFWRALGAKKRNGVMAIVHEAGFGDISAWNLSDKTVESLSKSRDQADADYERYHRV